MKCMTEETFGPTLPIMKVRDDEEAVRLANDSPYGLGASVFTRDTERGEAVARRLESGAANVNDAMINYTVLELPMGGAKASGPRLSPRRGRHPQVLLSAGDRRDAAAGDEEGTLHVPLQVAHLADARGLFKLMYGRGKRARPSGARPGAVSASRSASPRAPLELGDRRLARSCGGWSPSRASRRA